jgi:methanogenic corrinoid protein MtbC1
VLKFEAGNRLRAAATFIADTTIAHTYAQRPFLLHRYGESGKSKFRADLLYNVDALAAAVDADDVGIFLRYVAWLKILLTRRGIALDDLAESLRGMAMVLRDEAAGDFSTAIYQLRAALRQLDEMPTTIASFIEASSEEGIVARRCLEALLRLDAAAASEILEQVLAAGTPLARVYTRILPPLMREVGRLWQINEISVAHEHYCSAAITSILGRFYGPMFGNSPSSARSILIACVEGEQHELGTRALAEVFELNGWRTSLLGANLPSRELIRLLKCARHPPELIALSATMPTQLVRLASTIAAVRDGSSIPIMVGGYLFRESPRLAAELGADGYADDAEGAVAVADGLVIQPA